jgi:hypothetical protein
MEDRDQMVLAERVRGATLRQIGADVGLTAEGVRQAYRRACRQHVDSIVLQMWLAQKTGELVVLAVPAWAGPDDQRQVIAYLDWLLGEFEKRDDVVVRVHYRPTTEGSFCFALEDTSFDPKTGGGSA